MGEITWGTLTASLAAPFVFLLPGWALLSLLLPSESFKPERRPDMGAWLALAAGLTLALTPVALLILHILRLKIGTGTILAYLVISAAVIGWRRGPIWRDSLLRPVSWRQRLACLDAPMLALALVMALTIGVRLWVVRGINTGFWGDSYLHTLITQLVLDNGGLFESWDPYAPLQTFTYHFGFHGNVALFQWATVWLTGSQTARTVVLAGQFMNALAALLIYPLAVRLSGGRRWAGVGAVLIAGLLTPMPMFYVNWGRYTQLAGQIILPVAIWFNMEAVEAQQRDPRRLALAGLAVAGLALTHYLVFALFALFLVLYLAVRLLGRWRQWALWREGLLRITLIGACAALLVLPWAINLLGGLLPRILAGFVQGEVSAEQVGQENTFFPLTHVVPNYVLLAAGIGGLWALFRRRQMALLLLWVGCLFLLSNPHWLGLPGTGVVNNFTMELSLYIPASILAADLVGSLFDYGWRRLDRLRPALGLAAIALLVGAAWLGVSQRKGVIDTTYQLVTAADEKALAWVRQNTPEEAKFLANSFFAYGGSLIAGSDAGWWIPLLADRENTIPPLVYGSELGPDPGYVERVNAVTRFLEENALTDPEIVRYLGEQAITHVFVGEKGGPLLDPAVLQASPYYRAMYKPPAEAQGPWVFEVVQP